MSTRRMHAQRIVDSISPTRRSAIASNPIAGIEALGFTVVAEPALTSQRGAGGMCDGLSFAEHDMVMYAPTAGSKRENFTLLHEIAHILVENDDDALVWLADRDDPDVELEGLCEEIAAALVIPNDLVDKIIGMGPLTADDLRKLNVQAAASGPACAIALASRLPGSGAVIIIDRATNRIIHSSLRGDLTVYPWNGNEVADGHPLRNLQPDLPSTTRSYWSNTWGQRQTYYVSAIATEKRTYAILSVTDLWGVDRFHGGQAPPERSHAPRSTLRCQCGFAGQTTSWPCNVCGHAYCPRCGDCDCTRRDRTQQPCFVCFCIAPPIDLVDGVCSNCR